MSEIVIDVAAVYNATSLITAARTTVKSTERGFLQIRNGIDGKIQNRSNIRDRLNAVQDQLSGIEVKLAKISATVQNSAERYVSADSRVVSYGGEVASAVVGTQSGHSSKTWACMFKDSLIPVSEPLNYLSQITKAVGKYAKSDKTTVASSLLGYFSTLFKVHQTGAKTGADVASNMVSLIKSSSDVEKGLFDYFIKTLHPYEAAKLDAKFGSAMTKLKIGSGILGTVGAVIDTYKVYNDSESSAYDKAAETINIAAPVLKLGSDVYVAANCSTKTLQFVNSSKAVNQILATPELKYTTTKAAATKAKNIGAGVTIGTAVISGISSSVKQYGEVTADGTFDLGDAGSVGLNFGLSGLSSMANSLTFGVVDIDAEKAADHLEADADRFVQGDSWAAQYMRDQDNNIVCRFGVAVGSSAYLLGQNAVEGVANGVKAAGSWIAQAWNGARDYYTGGGFR